VSDVTHRAQAEPAEHLLGMGAHPPPGAHRQRVQEIEQAIGRYHQQAVRFAPG
jgi:hypothetical protein